MDHYLKLFRVTLKGMAYSNSSPSHNVSYVVAEDPTTAYEKVKRYLDDKKIGYTKDRELDKVELLASTYEYNNTGTMLYV